MEVICFEDKAFFALIDKVLERVRGTQEKPEDKWISGEAAMTLLQIKSKTTLQDLRNNGSIRYSQPQRKIIIYDRDSILEYLEHHAKNTF